MKRLLIRPGALGDFIVSIPAIECLRTSSLEIWTTANHVPLAARLAQQARSIASTGLDLLEVTGPDPKLLHALRGFDSIISWYGANRSGFREAVTALGLPFHFFEALPPQGCNLHAVDFYLDQARTLASCSCDAIPRIAANAPAANIAVIHPFAGSPRKRWPVDRFQELARRLSNLLAVEWCAGPQDDLPGARRFDNLYDLACWLASARVFIGNDSGPTHLAAAVGTPVVALFPSCNVSVWSPRGPRISIADAPSLEAITVEHVTALVQNALEPLPP